MTELMIAPPLSASNLGKTVAYDGRYNPKCLFPIDRQNQRMRLGITSDTLPFTGFDIWNHYEVSWLNQKGKPIVAIAEIRYPCESLHIIESKSMKLYFNSFNQTKFKQLSNVQMTIARDLTLQVGMPVQVTLTELCDLSDQRVNASMTGVCLDQLDVACTSFSVDPSYLTTAPDTVTETVFSNLLKSNCLVTNQPDWATVQIHYTGPRIRHEGLLQYLVSFRNHNEFHEHCIERIYVDIMQRCQPEDLVVYGRFTRRGGLDINALRSHSPVAMDAINIRLIRQ